jgi:hypothetical protein
LVRVPPAASGNSANVAVNNKSHFTAKYGQASVAGTFYDSDLVKVIQPMLAKILSIPLSLQAIVYPNPFIENITISFSSKSISEIVVLI